MKLQNGGLIYLKGLCCDSKMSSFLLEAQPIASILLALTAFVHFDSWLTVVVHHDDIITPPPPKCKQIRYGASFIKVPWFLLENPRVAFSAVDQREKLPKPQVSAS